MWQNLAVRALAVTLSWVIRQTYKQVHTDRK